MSRLSPFMLASHRFAASFQLAGLVLIAAIHAGYPDLSGLGLPAGWAVVFGAYSTSALLRHHRAVKAEQDKSAP